MRVTQQDIAKIANVSQATVSRVLAGDNRVEGEIRDRVVAAMRQHNYQPDARARSLRIKRNGLLGLVVKRPHGGLSDDPFFANLVGHIMDFLSGRPYHLCMEMVTDASSQEAVYDEMLRTRRVDGLLLVESEADDERVHRLYDEGFPFMLIGHPGHEYEKLIWSVDNDNRLAGYLATRHLLEEGYKSIGFIAGPRGVTVSEDRLTGYRQALEAANLEPRIWHSEFGFESARGVATAVLEGSRPEALIVLDDFMAMGTILAARELRLRIPTDVGVVAFNDSSICNLVDGGLTSVSLNISEMVRLATGRLLKIIEEKPIYGERRVIVPCELKARGSSCRGEK